MAKNTDFCWEQVISWLLKQLSIQKTSKLRIAEKKDLCWKWATSSLLKFNAANKQITYCSEQNNQ